MFFLGRHSVLTITLIITLFLGSAAGMDKIIIAQNGAGTPLIENTLEATTLAVSQGVEYLELPVVMSADDHLILFDDLTLNRLTDVAEIFPNRSREDGGYYVIDFTLSEIRQLRMRNVFEDEPHALSLAIPTLKEELSLLRKLEKEFQRTVGVMLEIKSPWFYRDNEKDVSSALLDMLALFEYKETDKVYLQCFEPEELQRIHSELLPGRNLNYPLIQMIDSNNGQETMQQQLNGWQPYNYDWLFTNTGLRMVASYAQAIGLPLPIVAANNGISEGDSYLGKIQPFGLQLFVYDVTNDDVQETTTEKSTVSILSAPPTGYVVNGIYTKEFRKALQTRDQLVSEAKKQTSLPPFFSKLNLSPPANNKEDATIFRQH